jgi:apolipoprotein N-acyltransferase
LKNILAITIILSGLSYLLKGYEPLSAYCQAGLTFFIPGIGAIFLISYWLSLKFEKIIDQPPLMIFILSIVIKMLSSLTLFLVYLMKSFGPANEGALVFIITYLIFEFLEIKRFLSILRPDSRENTPE